MEKKKDQEILEDELKKNEDLEEETDKAETKQAEETEEVDELTALKKENESLKEANLRVQAEFQNYKRRTEKEKSEIYKYANEKIVVELLAVMDNLDRALDSISHNAEDHQNVLNGVEMIKKSFEDLLEKEGVQVIEAVDQPFDPNLHHAVMTEEKDGCDSDVVIEEFQKGYKLGEKVVRPSMVKVSC
ncbi:nucleotide exchange factor GrpE [Fusibacter sp. JL216-2]|uniref:nucleotide exchange factor GrpE n=1 Tax=Fusibacter sp. JL216-2 TaxID=3071453 RepID=UPI003D32A7B2